jgi:diaminopimelate epimerase
MELTPRQNSKNVLYFSKYHGAGNDFILVDGIKHRDTPSWWHRETIQKLCHRHYGVGADGLIVLLESESSDYRMKYFNADVRKPRCAATACAAWHYSSAIRATRSTAP